MSFHTSDGVLILEGWISILLVEFTVDGGAYRYNKSGDTDNGRTKILTATSSRMDVGGLV